MYKRQPPVPRERLDDLLKSLRATEAPSQLALALKDAEMIRDEKRRVDERATPRRDYQTFGDEIHAVMERRSERRLRQTRSWSSRRGGERARAVAAMASS